MNFLHSKFDIGPDNTVRVVLDKQANVRLLDDHNFYRYKQGDSHKYFGGHAKESPVHLSPPHYGRWHVVVDHGGYAGSVRAAISVI
jgi:hypothetical protein